MKMQQNNIIELTNVTVKDKTEILIENISFSIPRNRITGFIGKSGAGKTSTLNTILQPNKITNGFINYDLIDESLHRHKQWLKTISYITQEPNLIENEDVYFNMKRLFRNKGAWYQKIFNILNQRQKQEMRKALKEVGLIDKIFSPVYKLSGGEKQRLEIAKALFNDSQIIFADEPTSNLDLKNSKIIMESFVNLKNLNKTIVVVIHDLNLALTYCDQIIVFDKGAVVKTVEKGDFQKNEIQNFFETD